MIGCQRNQQTFWMMFMRTVLFPAFLLAIPLIYGVGGSCG